MEARRQVSPYRPVRGTTAPSLTEIAAELRRDAPIRVVDDDPGVLDSLTTVLDAYGFTVSGYPSGAALLADDNRRRTACLIIDHHMPGMDGLELVATLRRDGVGFPTILITGRVDGRVRERATKLGVTATLEKPFTVARLAELIRGSARHD